MEFGLVAFFMTPVHSNHFPVAVMWPENQVSRDGGGKGCSRVGGSYRGWSPGIDPLEHEVWWCICINNPMKWEWVVLLDIYLCFFIYRLNMMTWENFRFDTGCFCFSILNHKKLLEKDIWVLQSTTTFPTPGKNKCSSNVFVPSLESNESSCAS